MAIETVQAVRKAELNAVQKEKDAVQQREVILAEAERISKTMVTSLTKVALLKAEQDMAEAKRQGEKILEAAISKAESEVIQFKEILQSKEKEAITLVLSNIN